MSVTDGAEAGGSLLGLVVLITRPAAQAEALAQKIMAAGGEPVSLPMQAIEPLPDAPTARAQLQNAERFDWWIYISANAVREFQRLQLRPGGERIAAVGAATAAALENSAFGVDAVPAANFSAEGLLALPQFAELAGQRVLVITGKDGRSALVDGLRERGAQVQELPVYRRVPVLQAPETVAAAVRRCQAIIATNAEALERLQQLVPASDQSQLLARQLVVPSPRVVERATTLGFTRPALVPEQISDSGFVSRLIQWRAETQVQDLMSDTPGKSETPRPERESEPAADASAEAQAEAADTAQISPDRAAEPALELPETPAAAAPAAGRSPWLALFVWLIFLILLAAVGLGAWQFWQLRQQVNHDAQQQAAALATLQQHSAGLQALPEEINALSAAQQDIALASRRAETGVAANSARLQATEELVTRIADSVDGNRRDLQLAGIEQLLLLANDRALLANDVRSAAQALRAADERLAALSDPRLFRVRAAIADERSALQAIRQPDLASMSLSLGSLIRRADALPLNARLPTRYELPTLPATVVDGPWYQRLWHSTTDALSSLYSLRREQAGVRQLLPPEEQALTVELLKLKLEGARLALLRGNDTAFHELCESARDWLQAQFQRDDPAVDAVIVELERLTATPIQPVLPDISTSLSLLREQIDSAP